MPNEPTGERLLARRYRLVTQVGRGGMGTVWQAHDEVLGRDVAVKEVILPHGLTDEERAVHHKRTFREARTAARLGHPGVVTVYDVVEEDDRPWIIMELIKARSLDQVIKQDGPLEPRRTAEIGRQMLAALHAAHGAGVLHRDVKPSNVLITGTGRMGERAVLTDFGIATAAGDATLTQTGLVMGSPAYIAPERARGRTAGPASDLWSLGVTLYAMLHGRSPFERSEPMAALVAVISEDPDPPDKGGRLVPVIEGLLRKNPDQRMDAIEAGALLDDIVRQETVDTQRTMAVEFAAEREAIGEAYAEPYPETYAPDQPLPAEPSGAAGRTALDPQSAGVRPDQLTSFDIPAKRSARSDPGQTAPDSDRAASWRPGPRPDPAGQVARMGQGPPPDAGTATYFPPTTHAAGRPALASNRNVLIIAAVVLALIVLIAGIALASSRGGEPARRSGGAAPVTAPASEPVPVASAPVASVSPVDSPSEQADGTPAGFRRHRDRTGYSVAVPADWTGPERKRGGDFFYSPDRTAYVQIDQTGDPGDSALDDWRRQERGGAGFPGYRLIRMGPTGDHPPVPDTGDGDDSADWEFTFDGDGGRIRILNRGFVADDHGYAILLRAPEKDWDRVFAELQPVYASFEPADDD